ncbi:hypothetical protein HF860_13745 [Enterococcus gallinarum]|uniref:VOC family protein n=1 Tax=Enterococcus gallinarum TaxID=1353 RepID=UPI0014728C5D|nr:VOC family protein [Enterococcus gallinarum]NME48210.1 hypothetical protein [Enterococcus gallinarum]
MQPIQQIHHISAIVGDPQVNVDFYREVLGLRLVKQTVNFDDPYTYHLYYSNLSIENGTIITFFPWANAHPGRWGVGTVHHIAWSVPNEESQINWQDDLYTKGYGVTEIKDRNYFKAVYFKEPGTILFEIATESPGFLIDEPLETLGTALKLPAQFEERRGEITAHLPKLTV